MKAMEEDRSWGGGLIKLPKPPRLCMDFSREYLGSTLSAHRARFDFENSGSTGVDAGLMNALIFSTPPQLLAFTRAHREEVKDALIRAASETPSPESRSLTPAQRALFERALAVTAANQTFPTGEFCRAGYSVKIASRFSSEGELIHHSVSPVAKDCRVLNSFVSVVPSAENLAIVTLNTFYNRSIRTLRLELDPKGILDARYLPDDAPDHSHVRLGSGVWSVSEDFFAAIAHAVRRTGAVSALSLSKIAEGVISLRLHSDSYQDIRDAAMWSSSLDLAIVRAGSPRAERHGDMGEARRMDVLKNPATPLQTSEALSIARMYIRAAVTEMSDLPLRVFEPLHDVGISESRGKDNLRVLVDWYSSQIETRFMEKPWHDERVDRAAQLLRHARSVLPPFSGEVVFRIGAGLFAHLSVAFDPKLSEIAFHPEQCIGGPSRSSTYFRWRGNPVVGISDEGMELIVRPDFLTAMRAFLAKVKFPWDPDTGILRLRPPM